MAWRAAARSSLLLPALAAACASSQREAETPVARERVVLALRRQLDLVLERRDALADEPGRRAAAERDDLQRLAADIAVRLLQVDPQADAAALVARVEASPAR